MFTLKVKRKPYISIQIQLKKPYSKGNAINTLPQNLANRLREHIHMAFQTSEKLPSVRTLAQEHAAAISTVQEPYRQLETRLPVEARSQYGYLSALEKR